MKKLTVVTIGTTNHELMEHSLTTTLNAVDCEEVIVFSDKNILDYGTYIPIKANFDIDDYNLFCLKSLSAFIKTEFVMIVQYDGMAVHKSMWDDDFYNYDIIGAPWPERFSWIKQDERVGNGGFCIRSAKLLDALKDYAIRTYYDIRFKNEDAVISQGFNSYLQQQYNIKYAPVELANKFSHEWCNDSGKTLGFHGVWNVPLYFNEEITRTYMKKLNKNSWYSDQYDMFIYNCVKMGYTSILNDGV